MIESKYFLVTVTGLLMLAGCTSSVMLEHEYDYSEMDRLTRKVHKRSEIFLLNGVNEKYKFPVDEDTYIEQVEVDRKTKSINIYFSKDFSFIPFRDETTYAVYSHFREILGWRYRNYSVTIHSLGEPIDQLIPNIYRHEDARDLSRIPEIDSLETIPIVRNISKPVSPADGLVGNTIALWHSHGWYYNNHEKRWSWQRPRLFRTVEDILPMSFTLNYLIPMLENAGANVFIPRERDTQVNEVIVDNDSYAPTSYRETSLGNTKWKSTPDSAFAIGLPPYSIGENPFKQGTHRITVSDTVINASVQWIPDIPESGDYSVQVAYRSTDSSVTDAHYTVYHTGGKTEFLVNQKIGGGTWIYLGTFNFNSGASPINGKVVLSNDSQDPGMIISADAVKFGGGMGNVEREGQVSRRPRYLEAARYYLQYAGIHDTLVYNLHEDTLDYNDDYKARGEWVNYLSGAPFGPNRDRQAEGLDIPVDLSLAFHTDAGITRDGSTIGTLSIYSYEDSDSNLTFPNGVSRLANRDLADILQTELVSDLRYGWDTQWNRRALMNAGYSEAYRPNVPSVLLELLSHQNYTDMLFANDPRFKFDSGRAIYKAFLKFISNQENRDYTVQPLPVNYFMIEKTSPTSAFLSWRPVKDVLEPTADPESYIVYTRIGDNGFDNGILVDSTNYHFTDIKPDVNYSFRISAVNEGGESFPSEELSLYFNSADSLPPVLVINGFDRISGPMAFDSTNSNSFSRESDDGVADNFDLSYTGEQYDYEPYSPFLTNYDPGYGSSWADFETRINPGNTHDFTRIHGRAITAAGRSHISVSDETVTGGSITLADFPVIDLILGEERESPRPKTTGIKSLDTQFKTIDTELQLHLINYLKSGGKLFISGAYIGTDLILHKVKEHPDVKFAVDTLKFDLLRNRAARTGGVFSSDTLFAPNAFDFSFNSGYDEKLYTVESPDALLPVNGQSTTILRYEENHYGAAIGYKSEYDVVIFGFPFESITTAADRAETMRFVIDYLEKDFTTGLQPAVEEENE